MPRFRALTVCVDYHRLLAVTLPYTLRHVDELLVITSHRDERTQHLVRSYPDDRVRCYTTDVFYEGGAAFNKGAAIERGFDVLGRRGPMAVLDADVVLPAELPPWPEPMIGCLWSPYRCILAEASAFRDDLDWSKLPLGLEVGNGEHSGYCQLFHASDPHLAGKPWYPSTWSTAGGCDSQFSWHWPRAKRRRPAFEVLHLGPPFANWEGVDNARPATEAERAEQLRREQRGTSGQ
jgi:hypothetical protein